MSTDLCQKEREEWMEAIRELHKAAQDYEPFLAVTPQQPLKDLVPIPFEALKKVSDRLRAAEAKEREKREAYRACFMQHRQSSTQGDK